MHYGDNVSNLTSVQTIEIWKQNRTQDRKNYGTVLRILSSGGVFSWGAASFSENPACYSTSLSSKR